MCGVIGYIGNSARPDFFYNGLKKLEYRGYDSSGIAMLGESDISIVKAQGKLKELQEKLAFLPSEAISGIGHTRWATHGKPSEENAHPHRSGPLVLLHNGIVENYASLKDMLIEKGYIFHSETDTEVAVHLLHDEYKKQDDTIDSVIRMKRALRSLVTQIEGSYAFAILNLETPEILYAVKQGSPLALGKGNGENYIASGITALVEHTKEVSMLEDGDIVLLTKDQIEVFSEDDSLRIPEFFEVTCDAAMLEKGSFDHFMMKEIHEHPIAVTRTLSDRVNFDSQTVHCEAYGVKPELLKNIERIQFIACGTSFYAASLAKYFIEETTGLPVEVDLASEYRYRRITAGETTLSVAISQSGETIDTLFAIRAAKEKGAKTLAIVNAPGSSIGLTCDMESLIQAGPEVGVASTKAFTAQMVSMMLLGLAIGQEKEITSDAERTSILNSLAKLPPILEQCLALSQHCKLLGEELKDLDQAIYMGRGPQWAVALEGALKLKELCYIPAEAYAAGELKHGPIALIDEEKVVVAIAPRNRYFEKTLSNIEEIKARGGKILGIGEHGDEDLMRHCDFYIPIPSVDEVIQPFVTTIPVHLFAYWMAVARDTDVDQPRNLAKSVTVE